MIVREYKIVVYNKEEMDELTYRGIVYGDSFSDIAKKIEDYYLTSDIEIASFELFYADVEAGIIEFDS